MKDLFDWLKMSKLHPLIKSCVFHYEFEFIHPFADGESTVFIEFMLQIIRDSLYELVENQEKDKNDGVNDGVNDGANDGVKLLALKTEDKILYLLRDNPRMTAQGLADTLGKSKRQIERILSNLKADGRLERVGAAKSGHWIVKDEKLI